MSDKHAHHHPVVMYDSVTVSAIPPVEAPNGIAAYVQGDPYPNLAAVKAHAPKAKILTVALHPSIDADCLDIEYGGASNSDAPAWYRKQRKRGIDRPTLYTSVSNAAALLGVMARAKIKRSSFRLWTAHYTYHEHRCGPACGFGFTGHAEGTQWTNRALGRNLDQSLVGYNFFDH